MQSLHAGDLKIDIREEANKLELHWLGMSNDRQPELVLKPFFAEVLQHAVDANKTVAFHFERIERFNSSTILSIIKAIQGARHMGIALELVYDPSRKWQRLSFDALRIFDRADGLFTLRTTEAV